MEDAGFPRIRGASIHASSSGAMGCFPRRGDRLGGYSDSIPVAALLIMGTGILSPHLLPQVSCRRISCPESECIGTNHSNLNEQLKCSANVREESGTEVAAEAAEIGPSSRLVGRKQIRKRADIRREHTELASSLFHEGAQMLPEGDQSWRLSPLFHEDDQDDQTN
jgi:hypothetical protein